MKLTLLLQITLKIIVIILLSLNFACQESKPKDYLQMFYDWHGHEETMIDPLIIGGDDVIPIVTEEIKKKNMSKRSYAILYLANYQGKKAIPILENIINDPLDPHRESALVYLYEIDSEIGKKYAKALKDENGILGKSAKLLLKFGKKGNDKRTYWQAYINYYTNGTISI